MTGLASRISCICEELPDQWAESSNAKNSVVMTRLDGFSLRFRSFGEKLVISLVRPRDPAGNVIRLESDPDPAHCGPVEPAISVAWLAENMHIARRIMAELMPAAERLHFAALASINSVNDFELKKAEALNCLTDIFTLPRRDTSDAESYSFNQCINDARVFVTVNAYSNVEINAKQLTLDQARALSRFLITVLRSNGSGLASTGCVPRENDYEV